ncbi:DUF4031 domain-containing protein [Streptomyces flavofungini]|uniref:DUF4031 domain-containing protein n=1 Tax=Streptomyces flavofungini TaxID=68200 RepID=UPI0034DF449E
MTVYVDEILDWTLVAQARGLRHTHWCHLTADTEGELHAFAARLGLRRSWFQRKDANDVGWHYDVTPNKRAQAVRLGAQEVDHGFIARLMDHRRRERDGIPSGGFACGNDPNAVMTDGDRKAIKDFAAFLEQRAAERPAP